MARSPSSSGVIEAFPNVKPIGPGQTGGGTKQTIMQKSPKLVPVCKSGVKQPGASGMIDTKANLSILKK